ncbi:MAG: peptidylprolyl isomerase [Rhodospirillales bacterium]
MNTTALFRTFRAAGALRSEASTAERQSRDPAATAWRRTWQFIRQEPLVHFCVLAGLIFAADAWLHPPAKNDHVIVVTKALRQSFIDGFSEDHDLVPSADDLRKMTDSWIASEILYREGKAAGVDRGDQMIRDRIAYKLQLLIFDQAQVARPTRPQLEAWFAENHGRFDEPERVGFYLTPATDEATARQQLQEILSQHEDSDLQQKTRAILGRPVQSIGPAFGNDFRDALLAAPLNQWVVLHSKEGWHVVRLDSHRPGKLARLDDVVDDASRIWHDDAVRKRAWEAVNRLKAAYTVRVEQ